MNARGRFLEVMNFNTKVGPVKWEKVLPNGCPVMAGGLCWPTQERKAGYQEHRVAILLALHQLLNEFRNRDYLLAIGG